MRRSITCPCAVLGFGVALCARAGVLDAPGADLEVSLITYGPGAIYWERFGHDAIRIRDRVSGESVAPATLRPQTGSLAGHAAAEAC